MQGIKQIEQIFVLLSPPFIIKVQQDKSKGGKLLGGGENDSKNRSKKGKQGAVFCRGSALVEYKQYGGQADAHPFIIGLQEAC